MCRLGMKAAKKDESIMQGAQSMLFVENIYPRGNLPVEVATWEPPSETLVAKRFWRPLAGKKKHSNSLRRVKNKKYVCPLVPLQEEMMDFSNLNWWKEKAQQLPAKSTATRDSYTREPFKWIATNHFLKVLLHFITDMNNAYDLWKSGKLVELNYCALWKIWKASSDL